MSRMIDRLFRKGLQMPPFVLPRHRPDTARFLHRWTYELFSSLQKSEVFVVDNVADYFHAGTAKEYWEWDRDFPCLAPPFPSFWMETLAPTRAIRDRKSVV